MDNIIIFADHNIGYNLVDFLFKNQTEYTIKGIYTNKNENSWWTRLESNPALSSLIKYYNYEVTPIELLNEDIDYLLLLSWKFIIPDVLIQHVTKKTINLHYSLLPKHRGVYPVNWAIQDGDSETGVTYHIVDNGIDTGRIIAQKKIDIALSDNAYTLLQRLDEAAFELFCKIWPQRNFWGNSAKDQNSIETYHSRLDYEKTNQINLHDDYQVWKLLNLLRAKSFGATTSAYFIDETTGAKYSVNINITKVSE